MGIYERVIGLDTPDEFYIPDQQLISHSKLLREVDQTGLHSHHVGIT